MPSLRRERTEVDSQFAPIEKLAVARQAVHLIRQMVLSGELKPGDSLPSERDLAQQLHVSRSSLREAIRALELVNVLEIRHGSGTFVTSLDPVLLIEPIAFVFDADNSELVHLFEARMVIETGAARLAASRVTETELGQIDNLVEQASRCIDDPEKFLEFDSAIHEVIIEASRSPMLVKLAASVARLSRESRKRTSQSPLVREQAHSDHRELVNCLRAREPEKTGRAMERHLEAVKRGYLTWLEEDAVAKQAVGNERARSSQPSSL